MTTGLPCCLNGNMVPSAVYVGRGGPHVCDAAADLCRVDFWRGLLLPECHGTIA
jgi:hypothetical protein